MTVEHFAIGYAIGALLVTLYAMAQSIAARQILDRERISSMGVRLLLALLMVVFWWVVLLGLLFTWEEDT